MNNYLILSDEPVLTVETNHPEESPKVIAGTASLPKITFSEEAYKEMKERFGWVDVEREAEKYGQPDFAYGGMDKEGFIDGCKFIQSLNKNRFSEEDMLKLYSGTLQNIGTCIKQSDMPTIEQMRDSLRQPKRVKVEFETLPNEIKITKLC